MSVGTEAFITPSLVGKHTGPHHLQTICRLMPNLQHLDVICDLRIVVIWNNLVMVGILAGSKDEEGILRAVLDHLNKLSNSEQFKDIEMEVKMCHRNSDDGLPLRSVPTALELSTEGSDMK
jgi:hypothetical protein